MQVFLAPNFFQDRYFSSFQRRRLMGNYQVKSSINIKPDNIKDLSFQLHVAKLCGLNISNCSILNINPKYVFDNKLDLNQFFVKVSLLERMKNNKEEFLRLLNYSKSLIHKRKFLRSH